MNQYKRLLSNTFIFAIGTFSSKILVILMLRFYTGILTPDEMGVADLIIKTTSILYPVVSLSIGQAVIRYGLERAQSKQNVFSIGLLTVLCGFLIALPFHPALNLVHYNTSAGATGSLLPYAWLIYLYVLVSCTQNVCSQFIRALGFVRLYAIDGIFRTFMTILLNILYLKVFEWNIFGYVFSIICADALSTVCLFLIAGLWKYFKIRKPNFHLWRGMLAYSLPLVPDAILVFVIGFSDQMFLAQMKDTAVSGIYSVAYRVPTLIALVASIFIDAWQLSMVNDNSRKEQIRFFSNIGNMYGSIVFIIVSGGVMCAKLAMKVLAVPSYYIGWTFIPLLALGAGFNCLSSFQKSVYLLEKKTVSSFISTALSAAVNITLNALLIPKMGGNGAALATLISYLLLFFYRALDSRRFMPVHWKVPRLALTVLLIAAQTLLMLNEPPFWVLWQLLLFIIVFLLNGKELLYGAKKILHRA
ncbi:lipopolysaccharide biosynthesis protein [Agathobaculum sp.]|uniref:lipopolysaccharide biosynthesis protein n=1 Tax=Agathobaculum sp. TaxID=2048138 RepID=UPI002A7FF6CB|nr:polysaccharide biosynthesis C-terminal domain-containing protein [Agathobaculum sp.]MDY3618870.1 polysaccharide biosynthesis C-terminal domain-containing protein [Agathobaculum sp.]